ncbi:MAG: hypothetical protein QOG61_2445 [Candidatus Binataceae bacterium]|jgi:hypothetical protein|nr:hypothetical protein [Candidatus Binataceae bacterium]
MTRAPFIIATVLGLPIFIAAAVFGPSAFDLVFHRRPPERFLIPAGYSGWVRVEFRHKDAPPLPMEDGRLLLKLDLQGTLQTSSDPQLGHGRDEFFYYSGDRRTPLSNAGVCKGGMVWQIETMVDDRTSTPFERFFVGTEGQYRHEVDPIGKEPACE